jgi:hypothetical protein
MNIPLPKHNQTAQNEGLQGVINYHFKKIDGGKGYVLSTNISDPMAVIEPQVAFNEMDRVLKMRPNKKQGAIVHPSITLPIEDLSKLNKEDLNSIAKGWISHMGYADSPYMVFVHTDTDKPHLHVLTTAVSYSGDSVNQSHDYYKTNQFAGEIEKKYALREIHTEEARQERFKRREIEWEQKQTLDEINHKRYGLFRQIKALIKENPEDIKHWIDKYPALITVLKAGEELIIKDLRKMMGEDFLPMRKDVEKKFEGRKPLNYKQHLINRLQEHLLKANNIENFLKLANATGYAREINGRKGKYLKYGIQDGDINKYFTEIALPKQFRRNELIAHFNQIPAQKQKPLEQTLMFAKGTTATFKAFKDKLYNYGIDVKEYSNKNGLYGIKYIYEGREIKASNMVGFSVADLKNKYKDLQKPTSVNLINEVIKASHKSNSYMDWQKRLAIFEINVNTMPNGLVFEKNGQVISEKDSPHLQKEQLEKQFKANQLFQPYILDKPKRRKKTDSRVAGADTADQDIKNMLRN